MAERDGAWALLEGSSATLYLVAGALLAVFAANTGARVFAGGGHPLIHSVVGPAGFFVGLVGLVSLYPGLADRTPIVARVVTLVAAVPLVGWFVIAVFGLGSAIGLLPGVSVVLPPAFVLVVFLTTMLAYLGFAAGSLRAGAPSRTVGLALLAPAIPFLTLIVVLQVLPPVVWAEFAIDGGHALAHLAVGFTLRARGVPTDRAEPAAEATP